MQSLVLLVILCNYFIENGLARHISVENLSETELDNDLSQTHYWQKRSTAPLNNSIENEEIQAFLLFAQPKKIHRFNLVTKTAEELPVLNLENVIAIEFDMRNNCVYWSDINLDTIRRLCLNSGESEVLVSDGLESVEGLALDWMSNNLYFTDGQKARIELIRIDNNPNGRMRRTILGPAVLKKPRGIALHPRAGYMFWTDWAIKKPSVNRANLDGSNIKTLFSNDTVKWPNGISIDYLTDRIYWVDARLDYIASSDLHGNHLRYIISSTEVVPHPFGFAVFKDNMYWDDWKRKAVLSADKSGLKPVEILKDDLQIVMDLKVYGHGTQVGTNACANTTCPYICVGSPEKDKSLCLCPNGTEYKDGKCLCPGDVVPLAYFKCSDEAPSQPPKCPPNDFVCGDGKCLPSVWKCDYDNDCSDGSDEKDCPRKNCTEGQFTCNNGRCIAAKWRCDGENDCKDDSDELNCDKAEAPSCKTNEFKCESGPISCLPLTWQCDGENDCRDGSDELNCNNNNCLDKHFACGGPQNRCIYSTWVCDGDKDCFNGRDERNCTTNTPEIVNNTEKSLENKTCPEWQFKCANYKCVPMSWKCDQDEDCGDGSDEMNCTKTTTSKPTTNTSQPGSTSSSPSSSTGDFSTPLPGTCASDQYQCENGECVLYSSVCDGGNDCTDASDELNCNNSTCLDVEFACGDRKNICINSTWVCDGKEDCLNGRDEENCSSTTTDYVTDSLVTKDETNDDGDATYKMEISTTLASETNAKLI